MIIRSLRLQPGKFAVGETKRLLQHYRHKSAHIARKCRIIGVTGLDGKALFLPSLTQMYGPTAGRKKFSSSWRQRSCINLSGL